MICKNSDVPFTPAGENVTRKVLAHDGKMLCAEVHFKKGSVGAPHTHPHEQIGYVVSGTFELNMNGEVTTITAGDTYYTAPNVLHGVVALTDGVLLDVFTPQREDFLK
ncbi:MAG: cupin domain-containing protein [Eubacteriales bacterium]